MNFIVVDWSSVSRGIITMPDEELNRIANDLINRQMAMALSRWDGEGGAGPFGPQEGSGCVSALSTVPSLTNTELVQLRVRVIALENLVIALLADASDRQLDHARDMAAFISPRPGVTQHPLTFHAAGQMIALVERAKRFRSKKIETLPILATMSAPSAATPYKRTAVFDEKSLPAALRREHRTKPGVWGVIRVFEGRVRYQILDPASEEILEPGKPGVVLPDQPHLVEPLGSVKMQVEFYKTCPEPNASNPAEIGAR